MVTHYLNYFTDGSGTFGYGAEDGGTPLKVGSRDDFQTQLVGNLGEVLLYGRALTGSDLQLANTYLAGRYGIATFQLETQPLPWEFWETWARPKSPGRRATMAGSWKARRTC